MFDKVLNTSLYILAFRLRYLLVWVTCTDCDSVCDTFLVKVKILNNSVWSFELIIISQKTKKTEIHHFHLIASFFAKYIIIF